MLVCEVEEHPPRRALPERRPKTMFVTTTDRTYLRMLAWLVLLALAVFAVGAALVRA
jgi:hypothetical protein